MHDLGDFEDSAENDDIESLRDNSKTAMMNIVYNAVIEGEDKAIKSESPVEEKVEALNNILNFFVKCEEYEKCSNIKKIIDKIRC
jgi:hypothetical protein|tara:strand:- start:351 stop:605 length:255 start_codon:yes stop_codon:yes gene_type:complete